ncbi:MAG: protein-disulfide reductase DsbD [Legionellaceae bacterium]|nr:protein-disulfide reductase DsbD [Legionellaceae bacterium]
MLIKYIARFGFLILSLILPITAEAASLNPPPAHTVFQVDVKAYDPNTLLLTWQIKPGFFLYRDRIRIAASNHDLIELADIKLPSAQTKTNRLNQTILIYRKKLKLPINLVALHAGETMINIDYQGCADDGFCYPPESRAVKLSINPKLALTHAELIDPAPPPPNKTTSTSSAFTQHHWPITLLIFLGLGLLLSFTPCVLPMIPVLSGILVGHGKNLSTRKAFLLSLTYVLSMSLTYAAIGAAVTLMGENFQVLLQTPWAIGLFSLLFVMLALSMFGAYDLKLPQSWQAKLANVSYHQATGHYLGAAAMGCLSTLILSPCVTAPLIGALAYIAQTGNIILGTASLFFLGLGMGLPLLLVGASLGRWLPHAGHWMNTVKSIFGIMLLGIAIYLLSRVISPFIIMLLWSSLLVFSGITLGAFRRATSHVTRLSRGIGIMLLAYGLLILFGASHGNTNPLKPLILSHTHTDSRTHTHILTTLEATEQALGQAAQQHQPVMLDFYADWCTACKSIEANTLRNPKIQEALKNTVLLKLDLTANNHESRALLHKFDVVAPPTFVFFDASGRERPELRLVGDISASALQKNLHALKTGS